MSSLGAVWWVILALVSGALGAEAVAWSRPLHKALLRWAARALPVQHRARYLEEWLAELNEVPAGPFTRLVWLVPIVIRRRSVAASLGGPPAGLLYGLKHALDLAAAACVLVVLAPVLCAVAMAVRLDSSGPVLIRQERVGKDGRPFTMLRFRSTVTRADDLVVDLRGASEDDGVVFRMRAYPRTTRVGRFLRAYSLDELPELINVLRGEMSWVGPRPPLAREVALYGPDMHRRMLVKPGLTGLWLTSSFETGWRESVRLDLRYVENWSFLHDLVILWRTLSATLSRHGEH